ncbi:E3 ubiquitin-protein ligase DTX3L-like [Platichthys flesus]|uniref:E3 ubiquitin-protein ligase DTX3L-like n=1 Tax=Platichthys flesus TaxID=8260 RepID=UPI002DBF6590|nr:E3 ubiquitin-protein ligase DTX3L-like [Platichthys flesus]
MAALEPEELMETGEDEGGFVKLPTSADVEMMTESQSKDTVQVVLSIKWEEGFKPVNHKSELTKAFQTWVNTNKLDLVIKVEEASDSEASIKINPAPGGIWADFKSSVLTKLREAKGQTLSNKNRKIVTVVSMRHPETQEPHNAPMNLPSPSVPDPQHELRRPVVDSAAEEETYTCEIPVATYLYMNHIYKENINRIAAENGVKIAAQVTVNFEPDKENGDPRKAMSEFRNLVQTSLNQSDSFSIPLGGMAREVLQKDKNKVVLTPSSEEMAESEPGQSQDATSKSLDMIQTTSTSTKPSVGGPTRSSYEKPQTIGMSIKDPLAYAGLDIEESIWSLLNTSFNEEVVKLKAKFNVDLKESGIGKGQVNIKALYRRSEPNKSMESHAVRALLRLYQRISTSPLGLIKRYGVSGFNSSLKTNDYQSEGASAGAVSKGPPGYNRGYAEEPTGGTVAVRQEDANCPICIDKFTNKTQLKCGHEFCKDCLETAKINSGPICPVCRDVFDVVEGDQPPGTMSWIIMRSSLDGFPNCGTIVITYVIPGGTQTERHPNPGQRYHGTDRVAYLPDSDEGREVLQLLSRAFKQKLIFTVGRSRTTGRDNGVTWNDIHHKSFLSGGPENYGYPDPDYLSRVREELKAKGIM